MILEHYKFVSGDRLLSYEFISEGSKGKVAKLIQFTLIDESGIYNLAFGDLNKETGEFDDTIVTDNGDSEKVLATVVAAIYFFSDQNPGAWIYAIGSTNSRTRLYRMGLNRYLNIAINDFNILGLLGNEWEVYERGKEYSSFLVQKKL